MAEYMRLVHSQGLGSNPAGLVCRYFSHLLIFYVLCFDQPLKLKS